LIVAEALVYAHERRLVHGGLSAQSIQLGDDGVPRIIDFALASLESASCKSVPRVGTRAQTAPELVAGTLARQPEQVGVYGLGFIFYQLQARVVPDRVDPAPSPEAALPGGPRPPRKVGPSIPTEFEVICVKAMAGDRAARYRSARELAAELRGVLGANEGCGVRKLLDAPKHKRKPNSDAPGPEASPRVDLWK
jgi:serine/threonine-protein kinase